MKPLSRFLIWTLLVLSLGLIIYGHIIIMGSGELFDKINKEYYNLHTRWVSDFAAKWPQGSWIKAGILLTCIAIFLLYRVRIKNLPAVALHTKESWFYHIVPLMMIVGLIIVLSFDTSHPSEQWVTRGFWPFQYKELVSVPTDPSTWTIEWYHKLGFRIFVASFVATVVGGLIYRRRNVEQPAAPIDWLILFSTLACSAWLFSSLESLPGIPQRFLLAIVFVWLWRETGALRLPETGASKDPNAISPATRR
jgi:hypothetical protein